jgi:hypothetical protein
MNPCSSVTGIVLSEDIRHHILINRIFHQPIHNNHTTTNILQQTNFGTPTNKSRVTQ